jgi:hypothetical protein
MGNERSGLLAFPLPHLYLFLLVLSLSKGLLARKREYKGEGAV